MGANLQIGNRPSNSDPEMGAVMSAYVGRMEYLLRRGRHVADIAMLYPIAALQADFSFAQPVKVEPAAPGGARAAVNPIFTTLLKAASWLRKTITWNWAKCSSGACASISPMLHPEILENKCQVEGPRLVLDNRENREEFRVVIVPGSSTISLATAQEAARVLRVRRNNHCHAAGCPSNPRNSARTKKCSGLSVKSSAFPPMDR